MLKTYYDKNNSFKEVFLPSTGLYIRSGILKNGKDTGVDPFMRNFPTLIDVGIMGHCRNSHLCTVGCYQGNKQKPNMKLEDFKWIVDQSKGKVFENSVGGAGDPNHHEHFKEIVQYSRENGIVPNYTTSGIELTDEHVQITKEYCGAVAVSWYKMDYTYQAIDKFLKAGCRTNIHYVLGNDSIDEAIELLENKGFPQGINAVIFLMYKPVGLVKKNNVLKADDPRVAKFFSLIDGIEYPHKIGLDACGVPAMLNYTKKLSITNATPCDGGSFSMYITPDMIALPCSFDNQAQKFPHDLKGSSIQEAWDSDAFNRFRNWHRFSCPDCSNQNDCRGGCPLVPEITLCKRKERHHAQELY
jgi:radical SAM protein with 4Fe4S-binding SPASM domain